MPELPEVETISRNLRPHLTGRRVESVQLLWDRALETPSPAHFVEQLTGQVIRTVSRRAKYIWIQLENSWHLFVHLRMSGDLLIQPPGYQPKRHDRLLLGLSDGHWLAFNDTRKFGRIWLTDAPQTILGKLGPEPFDPAYTADVLYQGLRETNRQLKPLLLDQSFVAGLGNIYTDEALHLAGLHPLTISSAVSAERATALHQAIRTVLETGIKNNGASIDWVYRGGSFQNHFRVYAQTGKPCQTCGTPIQRMVVGQRSTHICPHCQKVEP